MKHDSNFFDDVDEVIEKCEKEWPSNPVHIVTDIYHQKQPECDKEKKNNK